MRSRRRYAPRSACLANRAIFTGLRGTRNGPSSAGASRLFQALSALLQQLSFRRPLVLVVEDDPDDDKFLACALAAGISVIVSGDKRLRAVSGWNGIEILTPRQFIDRYVTDSA